MQHEATQSQDRINIVLQSQARERARVNAIIRDELIARHEDRHRMYNEKDPSTWGTVRDQRKTPSGRVSARKKGWLEEKLLAAADEIYMGWYFVARDVDIKTPSYLRIPSARALLDFTERQQQLITQYHQWWDHSEARAMASDFAIYDFTVGRIARTYRHQPKYVEKRIEQAFDDYNKLFL